MNLGTGIGTHFFLHGVQSSINLPLSFRAALHPYCVGTFILNSCIEPMVDYSVDKDRITLAINRDLSDGGYDAILACLTDVLTPQIKALFVDKKGFKRKSVNLEDAKEYGRRFGTLLKQNGVRAALVIDPNDTYESAMCVYAMEIGAKIMTTESKREALLWLDGKIN